MIKMAKCPSCGFIYVGGTPSKFKCTARQLSQYKKLGDDFCVYYRDGDCIEPESKNNQCEYKEKKPDG